MKEETFVRNLVRHKRVLEGMLTAMVGNRHVAEDLFQEVAIVMTRKREETEEDCRFVAWGRRIGINVVRDYRKKMARRKVFALDPQALAGVAQQFEEADDAVWESRHEALRQCTRKLPARDRELLRRRYLGEEEIPQLASSLSTSRGAVDTWLYRIRKNLHQCISTRLQKLGLT